MASGRECVCVRDRAIPALIIMYSSAYAHRRAICAFPPVATVLGSPCRWRACWSGC